MKALNDQWIEEIEGVRHMVKAIPITSGYVCHGCMFYDANIQDCSKYTIPCDDKKFIIKDLGPVNEEGCLAEERSGKFPEIEHQSYGPVRWSCLVMDDFGYVRTFGDTKQEAIDAWNRRHA